VLHVREASCLVRSDRLTAVAVVASLLLCAELSADDAAQPARSDAKAAAVTNPLEGDNSRIAQGRSLFNQYCAHCHGPNALSPDPPRDLRRLNLRYGDRMTEIFHFTVTHGRADKGMPNW